MNKTEGSEKLDSKRNEIIPQNYETEEGEEETDEKKEINPELMPLYRLENKIEKSLETRKNTGDKVKAVKKEYDALKGEIKKFYKKQIVSSNQVSTKKRIRIKKTI